MSTISLLQEGEYHLNVKKDKLNLFFKKINIVFNSIKIVIEIIVLLLFVYLLYDYKTGFEDLKNDYDNLKQNYNILNNDISNYNKTLTSFSNLYNNLTKNYENLIFEIIPLLNESMYIDKVLSKIEIIDYNITLDYNEIINIKNFLNNKIDNIYSNFDVLYNNISNINLLEMKNNNNILKLNDEFNYQKENINNISIYLSSHKNNIVIDCENFVWGSGAIANNQHNYIYTQSNNYTFNNPCNLECINVFNNYNFFSTYYFCKNNKFYIYNQNIKTCVSTTIYYENVNLYITDYRKYNSGSGISDVYYSWCKSMFYWE